MQSTQPITASAPASNRPSRVPRPIMTDERFWRTIDAAAADRGGVLDGLRAELATLVPADILAFHDRLVRVLSAGYQPDVWAASRIAAGAEDLDELECFIAWLVSKGEDTYRSVLDDPNNLAELLDDDETPMLDGLTTLAAEVYEEKTGVSATGLEAIEVDDLVDETWNLDDDDLERNFPDLVERFGL